MKKLLQLVGFVLFLVLNFSCSKDDAETNLASGGENGGQVSRYQIVTLNFQPGQLTSDTYMGTWNNTPITLAKADNQLFFYVSGETPLGSNQLVIPTLNNTKINYQVVEATLTQTPTETLQPLLDFQQAYGATLTVVPEDAIFLENHNLLTNFLSGLSDEDKIKAAKFYKANKAIFDPVYNTDYNLIQGRAGNQTQADFDFQRYRALINRHKFAVAVTVVAGVLAATPPYDLVETGITVGVALAGIYKSREIHGEIIDDVFRVVEIKLNNDLGINNRSASSGNTIHAPLTLTDNQLITVPFSINAKNFSNADSNVQKEFVQIYFTAKNKLNSFIGKANEAITWLKNNSFFLRNLRTINTTDIPNTAPLSNFDTNTQIMQGFSFSINHPNLSLETARLSSTGQLDLKIKLVGNPSTTISSTLNYSYNDDFSSFSGSFPLVVQQQDICTQNPMTPPVITGVNWECNANDEIAILISFTADGTGILAYGGTGACDLDGICYPVRLYFKSGNQPYAIAANGYRAFLRSGNLNSGVVEINFTSNGDCTASDGYQSFIQNWGPYNYQWKVEVMNQCNQRSNQVQL